jgi:hypothetical protein
MEHLEKYYYSNHPINMLESCNKTILPSPILDFSYLKIIPGNLRLFLACTISIKIPRANNFLVE